jgi:hypothetical protein
MRNPSKLRVKLPINKVIVELSNALANLEKDYSRQDKLEKEYKKTKAAWKQKVAREAIRQISKVKSDDIGINERYDGSININLYFPKGILSAEPKQEYTVIHDWEYKSQKEELESLIRILCLTEDEYISASTYHSISKYL